MPQFSTLSRSAQFSPGGSAKPEQVWLAPFLASQFSPLAPSPAALPYNPALSLWLSVDPLSDKYPGVSPYVYCGNNPVRLVDVDGREWEIEGLCYNPGSVYDGVDETIRAEWNTMNAIYETPEGKKVIDAMNQKGVLYSLTAKTSDNALNAQGLYQTNGDGTGGTIYLNGHLESGNIAHEMFHGYQDLKGQGKASIHNEVQARIFATIVSGTIPGGGMNQLQPAEGPLFEVYQYNAEKVLWGDTSNSSMQYVEHYFKQYFDGYDSLPISRPGETDLWQGIHSKIK